MTTIFNIYGVAITAEEVHVRFADEKSFQKAIASGNNLAVRIFLESWGFNRIPRSFADAVLKAAS